MWIENVSDETKKKHKICIWIVSHERATTGIKYADASTELAVSIATREPQQQYHKELI